MPREYPRCASGLESDAVMAISVASRRWKIALVLAGTLGIQAYSVKVSWISDANSAAVRYWLSPLSRGIYKEPSIKAVAALSSLANPPGFDPQNARLTRVNMRSLIQESVTAWPSNFMDPRTFMDPSWGKSGPEPPGDPWWDALLVRSGAFVFWLDQAVIRTHSDARANGPVFLQRRVHWWRFAASLLGCCALLWAPWIALAAVVICKRRSSGRCVRCGFDLRGARTVESCTECGLGLPDNGV